MKMKFNLTQRIASGYFIIILLAFSTGIFTLIKVSENRTLYNDLTESAIPIHNQIRVIRTTINKSDDLARLLLIQSKENNRQSLLKIHTENYPEALTKLRLLLKTSASGEMQNKMETVIQHYQVVMMEQSNILQDIESDLPNIQVMQWHSDAASYLKKTTPLIGKINADLDYYEHYQEEIIEKKEQTLMDSNTFLCNALMALMLLTLIAGTLSSYVTTKLLKNPIIYLKKTIIAMSKGEIPDIKVSDRKDEVGLINNAFVELTDSLKNKASFAVETGKGNYYARFTLLSERDELGNALVEMNKNLRITAEESRKEDWLKSGIAQMSDILRNEHSNTGVLYTNIISFISKYLLMNQGALYLIKEDREKIKYLEMVAGFACDKNKSLNKRVSFSEGFVGQCATEKKLLILESLPDNYLIINSGLGEANPKNIVIVPLLFENELQGVIELASFTDINKMQTELLEKLSGIIAATFDLINRKLHTELLLFESQDLNDKLIEREDALKKSNEDLTEKGKQLKVSEEELREQQEELMQINTQLEEKAQLLAEQNEEIRLKNEQLELAKEAIRIKAEELENTSRYKSEFLANMSHELRTPLNSILILSNLLCENKEHTLNEKQVEYARVVKRSGSDLLNLINDILDLSKIESRKIELELNQISLREVGGDIESLFRELAIEKKVNFKINYGKDIPQAVFSDKMRIEQIIKNLLSNAFKFTDKQGSVELSIDMAPANKTYNNVSINNTTPMISFAVKDSGIGIPLDKQMLIFEAFKQADGSTSRKYGGTGLGLSISKELSILLGGEIQIESTPGKGSTFTLYLPLNKEDINVAEKESLTPQPEIIEMAAVPVEEPQQSSVRIDSSSADRMILIIEDDEDFAKILLNHANKKGFTGMIATRGDTGLMNAKRFKPDAIILDLNLPGMDGWSVMRRLKQDPELKHIPVHIMSGSDSTKKAFPEGALKILKKPVNNEQLNTVFETLNSTLGKKVKKVLIIEDNAGQNDSIKALLENPELDCHSALTGQEAMQKVTLEKFDLITLDLSLPDITGFELLKQIKSLSHYQTTPVIIYTGKNLTIEESRELKKYSNSIILKTERSFERLVEETNLFLNKLDEAGKEYSSNPLKKITKHAHLLEKPTSAFHENMKGKKVLIVDDDIRNIFAMTSILEQQECMIFVANDGKEALSVLDNNPDTDIVLMDIMMPEMDGYEAMKRIRAQEQYKNLPIVALTAKAMNGDKEKCMEAGASDYLSKPVDVSKLMSMMNILLYQ